jgi:hypothetical protein
MSAVPVRVLVTGSRDFDSVAAVRSAISAVLAYAKGRPITIIHGGCRGADVLFARLALELIPDVTIEVYFADWARLGRSAGPVRNRLMVESGAEVACAFFIEGWPSRGTAGCVALAEQAGIPVRRWFQNPPLK